MLQGQLQLLQKCLGLTLQVITPCLQHIGVVAPQLHRKKVAVTRLMQVL